MVKPLIIFGVSKPNVYSFANIIGALEKNREIMDSYDIVVYRKNPLKGAFYQKIKDELDIESRPYVIIPYSLFTAQFMKFTDILNSKFHSLKSRNQNIITIAGGWHPTGDPKGVLQTSVDFVILGESEHVFSKMLNQIFNLYKNEENSDKTNLIKNVKNTIAKLVQNGLLNHIGLISEGDYYIRDIKVPMNNPDIAVNLDNYCPYSEKFRVFSPIEISRGCPFRCKFCQTGNYWNQMRHASVDQIVKWVQRAVDIKYDRVWFLSPNSFAYGTKKGVGTNPAKVKDLLKRTDNIEGLEGIFFGSFPSEVRPEYVTSEILDIVKPYISNDYFAIGAQTASDKLLKKINRGHTFRDVEIAIDLLQEYDYGVDIDFIFGLPGETEEDKELTLEFFRKVLKNNKKKIRIHTHTFMPLPGTPFWGEKGGHIDADVEEIVGKLATKGKAFGQYVKQSKIKKKTLKRSK